MSVDVANVGDRTADEVVQLYLRDLACQRDAAGEGAEGVRPCHAGCRRAAHGHLPLAAEQLAFTGVDGSLRVEPGRHRVMVGTSSVDLPCQADLEVVGELRLLHARSRFTTAVAVSQDVTGGR